MKKKLLSLALVLLLLTAALSGCGSPAAAPSDAATASAPESTAPAAPEEATAAPAAEPEASVSVQEDAAPTPEHQYHFPGSDTARLDYSNEYSLPISEDGLTLTWMRTQLNLMGPLGELGLSNLQDLEAIRHLQEITGVTIDYTEIDFWTAQEKMNVAIASGDYAAIISDLTYTGGATGAL